MSDQSLFRCFSSDEFMDTGAREVIYNQKLAKYHRLADQNGFHFAPAVFSHTGQIHESIKCLITDLISAIEHRYKSSTL